MQLNYSHLKILKLKIYSGSLFGHTFCVHVTWWQNISTLTICVFSLPFFLNAKFPIFVVSFFEKSPKLVKVWMGLLLQNKRTVKKGDFVTSIKIFTPYYYYNLIISPVLIWYLPDNKFAIIPSCFDAFKIMM